MYFQWNNIGSDLCAGMSPLCCDLWLLREEVGDSPVFAFPRLSQASGIGSSGNTEKQVYDKVCI